MGKGNPWIEHVMQTRKAAGNKGKSFKEILKIAKKTYKKSPAAHKKAHKKTHNKSQTPKKSPTMRNINRTSAIIALQPVI